MNHFDILFFGTDALFQVAAEAARAADLTIGAAVSAADLTSQLDSARHAVVVVERSTPDLDPAELIDCIRRQSGSAMAVFLLDETATASDAVRLVRMGAYHCVDAHASADELSRVFEQAFDESRQRLSTTPGASREWRDLLVGESPCMRDIERVIELVAPRRCTVLVTGETGTGKEVAARAIHMASGRGHLPMVSLNCSAIPEHLLEAELFGHTKGAFTGAVAPRAGRFEQANNSTLFLDEIGDMPIDLQAKLLRVLQERELQRLGSSETIKVNVRVIAASNLDLLERVKQGKFREDLYYRLNVVPVRMPALRERPSDIRLLARHFVRKICRLEGIPAKEVFTEALEHLTWYSWPGNVRQLENLVEKAVVMSGEREVLLSSDFQLPQDNAARVQRAAVPPERFAVPDDGIDFVQTVTSFEMNIVEQALRKTNGNKTLAADLLRLKRTTLLSKLRAYESFTTPGFSGFAVDPAVYTQATPTRVIAQ
jgi:DNA-binding NtrC family response regulator